jgi:hypothetical protein
MVVILNNLASTEKWVNNRPVYLSKYKLINCVYCEVHAVGQQIEQMKDVA